MNRFTVCAFALSASAIVAAAACRSEDDDPVPSTPRAGSTGVSGNGGNQSGSPGTGGNGTPGTGGTAGTPGGGGSAGGGAAREATLTQINNPADPNPVPLNARVSVKGLVATSQKFLVSKNACLWGVFATTAGDTTQEYGSIEVVAKGAEAVTVEVPGSGGAGGAGGGGTKTELRCPTEGDKGGKIPNDIKPGDVFDVVGFVDEFKNNNCDPALALGQRQIENPDTFTITARGGNTPAPKEFTSVEEINKLGGGENEDDFTRKWSGGLVRISSGQGGGFHVDESKLSPDAKCAAAKGDIYFKEVSLPMNSNIPFFDLAEGGPFDPTFKKGFEYTKDTVFTSYTGIYSIDFCNWAISVRTARGDDVQPPAATSCFTPPSQ
jgi:hypothetical protein